MRKILFVLAFLLLPQFAFAAACIPTSSDGNTVTFTTPGACDYIIPQTSYTLDCLKLDGTHLVETTTVNIIPVFEEK